MLIMLFGKKKKAEATGRMPTERVVALSSQGYSEEEIINTLKNEGYRPKEVDAALRDALKSSVRKLPVSDQQFSPVYSEEKLPRLQREPTPPPRPKKPETEFERDFEKELPSEIPRLPELPRPSRWPEPARRPAFEEEFEKPPIEELPPPPEPIETPRRPQPRPSLPPLEKEEFGWEPRAPPKPKPLPPLEEEKEEFEKELEEPEWEEGELEEEKEEFIPTKPKPKPLQPVRPVKKEWEEEEFKPISKPKPPALPTREIKEFEEEKWPKRTDNVMLKLMDIEDKLEILEKRIKSLEHSGPVGGETESRLEEYKKSIDELSDRTESVERALKDSLSSITKSLKGLADTIKVIKQQTRKR